MQYFPKSNVAFMFIVIFMKSYYESKYIVMLNFSVSLMMQNNPKQKKSGFDPFLLSLLTENKMDPMLSLMMTTNKDMSKMGPLLPLFFTGKTNKDPLLMQMLMTQQALPGWVLTFCFSFKISLKKLFV